MTGGDDAAPSSEDADVTADVGSGGTEGSDASSDAAMATEDGAVSGDELPGRPLKVDTANAQLYTIKFKPSDADPATVGNDDVQTAEIDTRVAPRGKLVVALSGVGNPPGPISVTDYAAALGFHAFAIAYENGFNPSTQSDPNAAGDSRQEEFDGRDHTKVITVARPDCVEVRVQKALAYLATKNAPGDWSYYLNEDQVRWSDVIFIGHSHGATSAAYYAKIRRVWRAISLSGPRDTNPVVATWLTMPSLTPIDRYYGFTGTGDDQHPDHLKAMEIMQYIGSVVDVGKAAAPYGGSHRLQYQGGHGDSTNCKNFDAACKYMLGAQ
jgi:hypothetical protein